MDFNKMVTENIAKGNINIIGSISNRKSYREVENLKFAIQDYMNIKDSMEKYI